GLAELLDLALEAGDLAEAAELVGKIRRVEGEDGALWRVGQAGDLPHRARRGDTKALGAAQMPASGILARRGDWGAGPYLRAEIAELKGDLGAAVADYRRAVDLGCARPALARRLVGLLYQRQESDQIDRVVQVFQDRGVSLEDLTFVTALSALRK